MTSTVCKLCGSSAITPRYRMRARALTILRCGECGFRFVDFYNAVSQAPMDTGWDYAAHAPALAVKFGSYCDALSRVFDFADKSVLDVGAGGGDFLAAARARGARVRGLDLDVAGVAFAREAFGIDVSQCLVEDLPAEENGFDAVTMWEVLEHLNDPHATVSAIARVMAEGGMFFLSTPCLDSAWDRVAFALYDLSFGWIQFPLTYRYSWTHLQIFSRRDVTRLLADHGFTIEHLERRTEFTYPTLLYLSRIRPAWLRPVLARIWDAVMRIVPLNNKMIVHARKTAVDLSAKK
jgi:2-polyprenyl-3-methyl-5-hydroxy-6-metoxy-1,4-benzoquinol methylase